MELEDRRQTFAVTFADAPWPGCWRGLGGKMKHPSVLLRPGPTPDSPGDQERLPVIDRHMTIVSRTRDSLCWTEDIRLPE